MTDPCFYREYECNLSAPYVRGWKAVKTPRLEATDVKATDVTTSHLHMTGISMYAGSFPFGTTFTFTPAILECLGETSCNGELSLYFNNDTYVNVTMAVIVRAKSTTLQALIYQRVGNFVSVESSISGNNVVFTVSPGATCSWIFRGI